MSDTPRTNNFDWSFHLLFAEAQKMERELNSANERIERLEEAFTELEQCNLTDENCANMDVATRRIRNFARRAKEAKP